MRQVNNEKSYKVDSSLGLLTNVPSSVLNNIFSNLNLNNENNKIEIVVIYRDLEGIRSFIEGIKGEFTDLGFNFGIVNIPIDKIIDLATNKNVQYLEVPKCLYETDDINNRASCVQRANERYNVSGKNVLIGFIDSGIDYTHPAFKDKEGNTRIEYIYD